jgi:hypothetical protein
VSGQPKQGSGRDGYDVVGFYRNETTQEQSDNKWYIIQQRSHPGNVRQQVIIYKLI